MKTLKTFMTFLLMLIGINTFSQVDSTIITKFTFSNNAIDSSVYKRLYDTFNRISSSNITYTNDTIDNTNSVGYFNGTSYIKNKAIDFTYYNNAVNLGIERNSISINFMFKTSNKTKQVVVNYNNSTLNANYPKLAYMFYTENNYLKFLCNYENVGQTFTTQTAIEDNKWYYITFTVSLDAVDGNTASMKIFVNGANVWQSKNLVATNPSWITFSPKSGPFSIGIQNDYYTGYNNFTGYIDNVSVVYKPTTLVEHQTEWAKITTKPIVKDLSVSTTTLNINATANSTATFNITSNTSWNVASNQTWLTANKATGSNNSDIVLTATANTATTSRTATITITGTGVASKTITITQDGTTVVPMLNVSTTTLNVNSVASTATFNITSNVSWTISSNQTWLTANATTGSNNGSITLTATANTATTSRTATITITGTGVATKTITITQSAYVATEVSHINIDKTPNIPTIDGNVDVMWDNVAWNNISKVVGTTSGITGKFKMCYDDNYIYVLVNKTDNTPGKVDASATYKCDDVELFFAMDTANSNVYRLGDWQIRKVDGNTTVDGSSNVSTMTSNTNFKVAQVGTTSMNQEWRLPISVLKSTSNYNNTWFRFDIQLADNNGSTKVGSLFWNSNADNQYNTILNQGYVKLSGNVLPVINYTLSVDKTTLSVASTANTSTFNITSNTSWNVASNQTWLTANKATGINNSAITLTATANTTTTSRTATITVSGTDVASKTITITQTGKSITQTLGVDKYSINLNASDIYSSFTIISNTDWTISSDKDWVKTSKTAGKDNSVVMITIDVNNEFVDRTATITITTSTITKNITITQKGKTTDVNEVEINKVELYPNPSKGIVNIKTTSNIDIYIYSISGSLVYTNTNVSVNTQLDLSNLKDGMYVVKVNDETKKLIIKK